MSHLTGAPLSEPPFAPSSAAMSPLYKQKSWSPDTFRDEAWQRRKGTHGSRRKRRSKSVTDDDLDEIKACIELGFGFDSPEMDQRLSDAFPAYDLFYAVNKQYVDTISKAPSVSSVISDCESTIPPDSPHTIVDPGKMNVGDNPQAVKTRLRQWAQVVACVVRQSSY
ncbi:uncharacterized protein LOC129874627 isoform X1 [Solanum dulcamara]|uniref:uncharacterized protein LOC129874627 isoform X1 n=1 Tax=Solanum dulcamara TaxID=45834 RepID=UPI0024863A1E|nr:uncharacterized protein LOC129874627 isoform X1 [Solanum dulcamara]